VKNAPYVMGFEEGDITGTSGRNLYVRNIQAQAGQRWAVVRPTHVFRTYGGSEDQESDEMAANLVDSDVATTTRRGLRVGDGSGSRARPTMLSAARRWAWK
jgi:hypothetical protein